jgi:hypothetical protein
VRSIESPSVAGKVAGNRQSAINMTTIRRIPIS